MDPQTDVYLRYYTAQSGGQLPAFHGARRTQYGSGLGDILGGIWRTVFPIALHGIGTFINSTLRARESGIGPSGVTPSWGSAANSALMPTALNLLSKSAEAIESRIKTPAESQGGNGKRRRIRKGGQSFPVGAGKYVGKKMRRPIKGAINFKHMGIKRRRLYALQICDFCFQLSTHITKNDRSATGCRKHPN